MLSKPCWVAEARTCSERTASFTGKFREGPSINISTRQFPSFFFEMGGISGWAFIHENDSFQNASKSLIACVEFISSMCAWEGEKSKHLPWKQTANRERERVNFFKLKDSVVLPWCCVYEISFTVKWRQLVAAQSENDKWTSNTSWNDWLWPYSSINGGNIFWMDSTNSP